MKEEPRIYIAGHKGMVGSAIHRILNKHGHPNLITKSKTQLNLLDQQAVYNFFNKEKPDQIYIAAARVGGINANNIYPANFIYENLMISLNLIHQGFKAGVKKILFLGSSCIYPKYANQPILEEELLSAKLEPTNEPYAIAKIAAIKLCESYNRQYRESHNIDYRSIMPTNLYGPGDNYNQMEGHVVPALIERFHNAKLDNLSSISIWGTGKPLREFLFVDDLAEACIFLMNLPDDIFWSNVKSRTSHINVGSGHEITIIDLANKISEIVGYNGQIYTDTSKPDGTPRKLLDSSLINKLGWKAKTELEEGLKATYKEFLKHTD